MCGIAGITTSLESLDLHKSLETMTRVLGHRGPNGRGAVIRQAGPWRVGLGHTRLAILDLSPAGAQPMVSSRKPYWLTYNGEVYNFRELRKELESQDYVFHSRTDSEVVLKAYEAWGNAAFERFRGMFSFGLWDEISEQLVLARDPFGIKPLYYYSTDTVFTFASEIRVLLASGLVPRKLSAEGLASYLQFGSVQDPLTIVDGVQSLLPGHGLIVKRRGDRLQVQEYSFADRDLLLKPDTQNRTPANRREAVTQLRSILEDSIRAHLVSDVPVAAFLSGGIDSSAIVGLMSRVSKERPRTFTVSFEEEEFSEQSYANVIARKFGTEHADIRLSGKTLMGMLPGAFAAMDQPTMDGVNTYVVSKAVRDAGIKVALSGLGGDELFAGYPSFRRAQRLKHLSAIPRRLRNAVAAAGKTFTNGSVQQRKAWDFLAGGGDPRSVYTTSRQLFSPEEIGGLMDLPLTSDLRSLTSGVPLPAPCSMLRADLINAVSRLELSGYMSNTLLRDTDQMSMAHALEVRVPFIDPVVVPLVLGMPGEWKLNGSRPKPLLLDALGDMLPEEIWRRPKMGFTLPFQRWMLSSLRDDINGIFADEKTLKHAGISDFATDVWQTFLENPRKERWSRPWALYTLAKWCALNGVAADGV